MKIGFLYTIRRSIDEISYGKSVDSEEYCLEFTVGSFDRLFTVFLLVVCNFPALPA